MLVLSTGARFAEEIDTISLLNLPEVVCLHGEPHSSQRLIKRGHPCRTPEPFSIVSKSSHCVLDFHEPEGFEY